MCSLFGLIDYKNTLTTREKNKILNTLARECECRGTDATGIAYNFNGRLRIFKRPLPAHKLKLHIPNGVSVVMGHTRMTTQGSAARNQNNHPFAGTAGASGFALAHNGMLWNDKGLKRENNLPVTNVETDSYVAVQLIEQQQTLDFDSLRVMAEKVEGSFVFTVLDHQDAVWFVKGNNPLFIFGYDGFIIYASTKEILERAVKRLRLNPPQIITEPEEGEILRIDPTGKVTSSSFIPSCTCEHWWRHRPYYGAFMLEDADDFLKDDLIESAKCMGVSEEEIQALLDYGCDYEEIEELLYNPAQLHAITRDLIYAYL